MTLFKKTRSEAETYLVAKKLAKEIFLGDILALVGDLGSGKTTFTKGLAKAFNIKQEITSPTFVLIKEYKIKSNNGRLVHLDCYRLSSASDARSIGLDEIIDDENNIMVIEWADRIKEILPKRTKWINFESEGSSKIIRSEDF